ncbi:putative riboflavin kinase [Helianthus annuus]|nr:putative riboflavin kinase [Helianthus annuus]
MMNSIRKLVSCVILDLDGTLVNTDGIVREVLKVYLVKYEKKWDGREAQKIIGKTPIEAAAAIVEDYGLPLSKEDLLSEISPMFSDRYHPTWKESFAAIVAGDEVKAGKPSPEMFLEAAKRLSVDPSKCLVIEDSLPGVAAAKAADMEVVAVPSLPKQSHLYTAADEVINSLLDLRPEKWGLPPFDDWIDGTLPFEPWHIGGPVIKGYGRGSKVLGMPTANLSVEGYASVLSEHPAGVYFGWAKLSTRGFYKMVMSIGWNPYFDNTEKTIEPWLLHKFDEDFYGEELHLVIVGYIRPEAIERANFHHWKA